MVRQRFDSFNSTRKWVLIISLIILILISIYLPSFFRMIKFFNLMNHAPAWTTAHLSQDGKINYSLEEMKRVALFLQGRPEQERRHLITLYYKIYVQNRNDDLASSTKLYLLLRVLFDVSENYSVNDVKYFAGWRTIPERPGTDQNVNLLWPLGFQNQQLTLKGVLLVYMGLPYDPIAEYDYFMTRFPLREVDELR